MMMMTTTTVGEEYTIGNSRYRLVLCLLNSNIFFYDSTTLVGLGILIIEVSRLHSVRHATLCRSPLDE